MNGIIKIACASLACTCLLGSQGLKVKWFEREEKAELEEDVTPRRGMEAKDYEETKATAAAGNCQKPYSWYCKHTVNGERPILPAEMSFVGDYDAYFVGGDEKVLYLTFDAGYENGNVAKILDVLKDEEVPAAFFVLEHLVTSNTDLIKRMIEEGHTVCNHTAKHRNMALVGDKETFAKELAAMETIYRDTVGAELSKYYRPPEGSFSEDNLRWAQESGYKTILWSFAYADWDNNDQMSAEKAKEKILAGTHNGEILLLHPTSATNAAILKDLIHTWKEMGYTFGTMDQLTGEK